MQRRAAIAFVTRALALVVASPSVRAQEPPDAIATLTVSAPRGATRRVAVTAGSGAELQDVASCVAPCRFVLEPGRYRLRFTDVDATQHTTLTSTQIDLSAMETHVRLRHRDGLRTGAVWSLGLGPLTMLAGGVLIAASAGGCSGGGGGGSDWFHSSWYGSYGGSPPICHPGNDAGLGFGAALVVTGAVSTIFGGIAMGVSRARIEVTHPSRVRFSSASLAPTRGGVSASLTLRF